MARYVIKRLLLIIPVILCVSLIVFALVDLAPGDIVDTMTGDNMTTEDIAELRRQYDLDKPMLYRWGKYMLKLVQGDLGISQASGYKVWDQYIYRLPNTMRLSLSGLALGASLAIPLGIFAARHAGTIADNLVTLLAALGVCMPSFWLALILLQIFSQKLGWFPAGGMDQGVRSMVLPVVCSGLMLMASATRQTRSSMLEVLRADYLRTVRAKGVPEKVVIRKHALGNALIPIITVIGNSLSHSLAGSVIIENVFSWPGVGRMAVEGVTSRDTNQVLGTVILTTTFYVLIQIFVDIAYAFADPRIKSQYVRPKKRKTDAEAGAIAGANASASA
jgi:peptide/nickel transport system permease protein